MSFEPIKTKMVAEGIAESAISAFESTFNSLQVSGLAVDFAGWRCGGGGESIEV